jgi:hypothetical protein
MESIHEQILGFECLLERPEAVTDFWGLPKQHEEMHDILVLAGKVPQQRLPDLKEADNQVLDSRAAKWGDPLMS